MKESQQINENQQDQLKRQKIHRLKLMACLGVFLNYIQNAEDLEKEFQDGQSRKDNTYFRNRLGKSAFACIVPVPKQVQEIRKVKKIFSKARNLIKLNINAQYLSTEKNKENSFEANPQLPVQTAVLPLASTLFSFKRISSKVSLPLSKANLTLLPSKKVVRKLRDKRGETVNLSISSNIVISKSDIKNIRQPLLQFKILRSSIQNLNQKLNYIRKFLNSKSLRARNNRAKAFKIPIHLQLAQIIRCINQITSLWHPNKQTDIGETDSFDRFLAVYQEYKAFVQDFSAQQKIRIKKAIQPRRFDRIYKSLIHARLSSYIIAEKLNNAQRSYDKTLGRGLQRLKLMVSSKSLQNYRVGQ